MKFFRVFCRYLINGFCVFVRGMVLPSVCC